MNRQIEHAVDQEMRGQKRLIDASGMGLLPGVGIALAVALIAVAAIGGQSWWLTFAALGVVIGVASVVALVVFKVAEDDDPEPQR
jgi:hypothetical protein